MRKYWSLHNNCLQNRSCNATLLLSSYAHRVHTKENNNFGGTATRVVGHTGVPSSEVACEGIDSQCTGHCVRRDAEFAVWSDDTILGGK